MRTERQIAIITALCILFVSVAAGPLVPGIDVTASAGESDELYTSFGDEKEGVSVDRELFVSPQRLPAENVSLEERDAGGYRLAIPDALLYVETGAEPADVTYRVSIPELDHERAVTDHVAEGAERSIVLSIPTESVEGGLDEPTVEATVTVTADPGTGAFTVTERTVVLEVDS